MTKRAQPIDLKKVRYNLDKMRTLVMGGAAYVSDTRKSQILRLITDTEKAAGGRYEP